MMKKRYKENTGNFIKKFRRGMLVIIMAGIFLTACGNRNEEEEGQSELQPESAGGSFNDDKEPEITLSDITGDGKDEVLIYRYFVNTATEYTLVNFFRIEEKSVTEISPEAELEELAEDVWNVIEEDFSKQEYDMPILRLESYDKVPGLAYPDKRVSVGYQDGGWQILEWVDCPKPDEVDAVDELAAKRTDENAWAFDYLALLDELEQDEYYSEEWTEYKLVYIDGDIPALAVGYTGYEVSVFLWHDGEITTLMDKEGYGLRGRYWGCQPYRNIIYVHDFDNQSRTEYWDFYQISESCEREFLYGLSCTTDWEKNLKSYYYYDQEDSTWIDDHVELTEEEFLSYPLEDTGLGYDVPDYVEIAGDSDIDDMRWQLGRIIDPNKEEAVFLRRVTDSYDVEKHVRVLHFLFSNDTLVDVERKRDPWMQNVIYRDITGDGIDEVLVYQEDLDYKQDVYAQTYLYIDFFQIEEDVVTEISPWTQLEELGDDPWNMEIMVALSKKYGGIVLKMENYGSNAERKCVDKSLLAGYRDGVWEIIEVTDN